MVTITKAESQVVPNSETGAFDVRYQYHALVDTSDDLANIPTDALPGSLAFTADGQNWWMLGNDGSWADYGTVPEQPV